MAAEGIRLFNVVVKRFALGREICRLSQLHLDRMNTIVRAAIVSGGPASPEAAITYCGQALGFVTHSFNGIGDSDIAGQPGICTDIEVRQILRDW